MTDYQTVAAQLDRVRGAWKRAATLSGLTIMVLEAAGLLTIALVIDILFSPGAIGRGVILLAALSMVGYLLFRHVLRPIVKHISDRQIALYVEERNPNFEGALIAAAEFGPTAHLDARHQSIIEAIIREAEGRARQFDLRAAIDFSRLRKYGMLLALVFGTYGLVAAAFPDVVSHHAKRVLTPWQPEVVAGIDPTQPPAAPPIIITLDRTEADLLRGTSFDLEATLTRDPAGPVRFHFRPLLIDADEAEDDMPWHALAMDRIEKLYGYGMTLPDINEPIEFYVSAENYESVRGRITVFDPLTVESMKLVTTYPEYLQLPDNIEYTPNGDVATVIGSTVTLQIATNRPLASGKITWDDGEEVAMIIAGDDQQDATVSFVVNENRTFRYRIEDVGGQVVESAAPAFVSALQDQPPTLELMRPTAAIPLTPLGEITFVADVNDDYGIAAVELVYQRGAFEPGTKLPEHVIPLTVKTGETGRPIAEGVWQLEQLDPVVSFGDVFTYFVRVRDRKGQMAISQAQIAGVKLYEVWATEDWSPAMVHMGEKPPEVPAVFQAVWMLHQQKSILPEEDFIRQTEELAQSAFIAPTGEVWPVFLIEEHTPAALVPIYEKFQGMFADAYKALAQHDSQKSVDILQSLLTQMLALGLTDSIEELMQHAASPQQQTSEFREETEALAQLEAQLPDDPQVQPQPQDDSVTPPDVKKAAEDAKKAAEDQKKIAEKAKDLQKQPDNAKDQKELAKDQDKAADKTKQIAQKLKDMADKNEQLDKAARDAAEAAEKMRQAAKNMQQGRMEKAADQADKAHKQMDQVAKALDRMAREELDKALADAERKARNLRDQQKKLQQQTAKLDKPDKRDDAARDRDFKKLAKDQAQLKVDLAKLQNAVAKLDDAVKQGRVKRETGKHITDAQRNIRRGRIDRKLTNAAVELAKQDATAAKQQQDATVEAVEKVVKNIQAASDSLASDYEAELERARREAKQLTEAIAKANPEAAKKADQKPEPKPEPSKAERQENAKEAAHLLDRLERHVKQRQFVDQKKMQELKEKAGDLTKLPQVVETDAGKAFEMLKAAKVVAAELDAAYERHQEAKRLFSAQREGCPPQYRELVNQYFETLSNENSR